MRLDKKGGREGGRGRLEEGKEEAGGELKEGREVDVKEEMKEGEDIEKRKAGQQSIPVNIWSKRKEHNALHENTSNTKRKS